MEKENMSICEAARALNVSTSTMYSRIRAGLIPSSRDALGNARIETRHVNAVLGWSKPFGEVIRTCRKEGRNPLSLYDY